MPGPLKGVRVLDLTGVVSGPFATMFLADQGADVLKIEPIGGDITRRSRAIIDHAGEFSALFISSNRGKRSLSIDIKSNAGREVLEKISTYPENRNLYSGRHSTPLFNRAHAGNTSTTGRLQRNNIMYASR